MRIELATESDAAEILALQKLAYLSEAEIYNDYTIDPLVRTIDDMISDIREMTVLKAVEDSKIIGSVRAGQKGDTCYIGKLMVYPDHQNQGIGAVLMNEIESRFTHAARYELFTGHLSEKNLYLYDKLGYRRTRVEQVTETLTLVMLEKQVV